MAAVAEEEEDGVGVDGIDDVAAAAATAFEPFLTPFFFADAAIAGRGFEVS